MIFRLLNRCNLKGKYWTVVSLAAVILSLVCVSTLVYADQNHPVVVSLGDSYSAGEGVEPFYHQNEEHDKNNLDWLAHRSEKSWPGKLRVPTVDGEDVILSEGKDGGDKCDWYFVASSGAETKDLKEKQEKTVRYFTKNSLLEKRIEGHVYHLPPQLSVFDTIPEGTVDYVTLTLGGNDAHFVRVMNEAANSSYESDPNYLTDCFNGIWREFNEGNEEHPTSIRDRIITAYQDIEEKAGKQAKIIVAGYPLLLDPSKNRSILVVKELFDTHEAKILNANVKMFNASIRDIINDLRDEKNMNIHFVSVEERFEGHSAYAEDSYLNEIILGPREQDLDQVFSLLDEDKRTPSAYSMHPNEKGIWAYARAVQDKIDQLEDEEQGIVPKVPKSSGANDGKTRDIALVLDTSGSMEGDPLDEVKRATVRFGETVLGSTARVGLISFSSYADVIESLTNDSSRISIASGEFTGSGETNLGDGMVKAKEMLTDSSADRKIIVLMTDGEPNIGMSEEELISYTDQLKENGYYVYTLGFFSSLEPGDRSGPQQLLEKIASEGCHYEVTDAADLKFFFGDIADQINGVRYNYIRIACPVDVTVTYNGETLTSSGSNDRVRTSFGTLTFEDAVHEDDTDGSYEEDDGYGEGDEDVQTEDAVKILRLLEGPDYDININGTGTGSMDYSIGFVDDDGEYSDMRYFDDISIESDTKISTVAKVSDKTQMKVDYDGDGKIDETYEALPNSHARLVDNSHIINTIMVLIGFTACLILAFYVYFFIRRRKRLR